MREARLTLNRDALLHNVARVRACAPDSRILAMVKADAYGHGALTVAAQLAPQVDALGVAWIDEALALRDAGVTSPIVLMEGVFNAYELATARALNMQVVVHQQRQLDLLAASNSQHPLTVWLKVDSGMHRLGFSPEDVPTAYDQLESLPGIRSIVLCSHFASADLPESAQTDQQALVMQALTRQLPALPLSLANSASILGRPDTHHQWVRPGIMLYGSSPFADRTAADLDLKPVMTLTSRLISTRRIRQGEAVGYGATWIAPVETRIGVVAIGYGDGYPRHAPSGTPVMINGKRFPIVGRVSMDMITVDLGDQTVDEGDEVILWGDGLSADEVAVYAGTISYELFCQVTARVERQWK